MTPAMAWLGVTMALAVMGTAVVVHQELKQEVSVSKIEAIRRDDPLPPPVTEPKKVPLIIFRKSDAADANAEPIVKPPVLEDAHPIKAETLPSQVQQPKPVHRDAEPRRSSNEGVCGRYGGHKVTFHKRNGWESWRCVYPR